MVLCFFRFFVLIKKRKGLRLNPFSNPFRPDDSYGLDIVLVLAQGMTKEGERCWRRSSFI